MTDIIIVGAGPAGSTCAAALAEYGLTVKLIDKTKDFQDRTCGGAIGPRLWDYNIEMPQIKSLKPLRGAYIHAPNGSMATLACSTLNSDSAGYIFDRNEFDKAIAERAEKKGVELILGERVKNVYRGSFGQFDVITEKQCYKANIVVDASGMSAKIAKKFGVVRDLKPAEYRFTVQAIIENSDFLFRKDFIAIYLGDKYANDSYAWVFPDGDARIKVGLGVTKGINANTCLREFIRDKQIEGKILEWRGRFLPVAKPPSNLVGGPDNKILALGDAGRLCDAFFGAGIATAIASGKAAAKAIGEGTPEKYNKYLKYVRRDLNRRWLFRKLFPLNDNSYNIIVDVLNDFDYHSMNVNRELARAMMRFLWLKGKDSIRRRR